MNIYCCERIRSSFNTMACLVKSKISKDTLVRLGGSYCWSKDQPSIFLKYPINEFVLMKTNLSKVVSHVVIQGVSCVDNENNFLILSPINQVPLHTKKTFMNGQGRRCVLKGQLPDFFNVCQDERQLTNIRTLSVTEMKDTAVIKQGQNIKMLKLQTKDFNFPEIVFENSDIEWLINAHNKYGKGEETGVTIPFYQGISITSNNGKIEFVVGRQCNVKTDTHSNGFVLSKDVLTEILIDRIETLKINHKAFVTNFNDITKIIKNIN